MSAQTIHLPARIETRIENITPERAKAYLLGNTRNRRVGGVNLGKLCASMRKGEWKLNGEAIKIASDGTILDGQHRLMACVETGTPFETLIVTGLPFDTQDTMDTGKSRTLADVLTLNGYKNGVTLAAVTTGIMKVEKYGIRSGFSNNAGWFVTNKEALDRLDREGDAIESVASAAQRFTRVGLHSRTAGVLIYLMSLLDAEDADYFFAKLQTGDGLDTGSPILALRSNLLANKSSNSKLPQGHLAALAVKAWNKYRAGEQVMKLRFTIGGANPEAFPEPK